MTAMAQVVSISKTGFARAVSDFLPLKKAKEEIEKHRAEKKLPGLVLKDPSGAVIKEG